MTSQNNPYFVDPESGAEMARLLDQDRMMTKAMGGLFPSWFDVDPSSINRIVDLACGPGGWVQEMALAYPDKEVYGVDISSAMIDYANMQAEVQGLCNANFTVMDLLGPIDFPDNSFDLVNARLIGFIPTASWPPLIAECVRIARSGAVIRLCEGEWLTNSPAYEKLQALFTLALKRAGQSFSPDGRLVAITPMLTGLLKQGRCESVKHAAQAIDFSAGTAENYAYFLNFQAAYKLMQPFLLRTGVITEAEADILYEQMLWEMRMENFRGLAFFLNAWGRKPSACETP